MGACRSWMTATKRCARCGAPFECAFSCCWCDEIRIDESTRAALREQFTDCLCRACLTEAATHATSALASTSETKPRTAPD